MSTIFFTFDVLIRTDAALGGRVISGLKIFSILVFRELSLLPVNCISFL